MGGSCVKCEEPVRLVILGLDAAGKSTVLYRLQFDQYFDTLPTVGFNCEKITGRKGLAKGVTFSLWDVGGQDRIRPLWKTYTKSTDGIVFVVDSVDTSRIPEAKGELWRNVCTSETTGVPLMVIANKQDLPGAQKLTRIESMLDLKGMAVTGRMISVCGASAKTGDGLDEALDDLYKMILKRRSGIKQAKK